MKKQIYRNWDHYWQQGNHGFTSASREYAKHIWDDFETTINASRDDYKNAFNELAIEVANDRSDYVQAMREYMDLYTKEGSPKFARWWYEKMSAEDASAQTKQPSED